MSQKRFLVAEDDAGVRALMTALLSLSGMEAVQTANGSDAIDCLRRTSFDGVILDLMMPSMNGFEVLDFIRAERPHLESRTIVVTAAADHTLRHFDASNVHVMMRKPFEVNELLGAVRKIATSEAAAVETQPSTARAPLH
jgi:CheY-like chemotaxis protein